MPNVYAILGAADTHKSSTVRALTGVSQWQSAWNVATPTHPALDFHVEVVSLQESNISPEGFVERINAVNLNRASLKFPNVANILIPLRITGINGLRDGAVYLQHFISVGWNIMPIVIFGAAVLPTGLPAGVRTLSIFGSASMAANGIASQIRPFWNWL